MKNYLSAIGQGHPDKLCDFIADSILDACLAVDPLSRVACEVMATKGKIIVAGEITSCQKINVRETVRIALKESGYDSKDFIISVFLHAQSLDIDLWNGLLDHIEVHSPNDVRFLFRDGSVIKVDMSEEERKRPALTEKQKEQITELRRNGLTYDNIGKRMGLPTGQIRSFCLSRIPVRDTDNQEEGEQAYCKTCGKMLVHTPGYRKKIFCSDGCRQDWWNHYAQIKTGKGWATNEVICQGCGKTFATYGVKRKYCSRKCYVEKKRNQ